MATDQSFPVSRRTLIQAGIALGTTALMGRLVQQAMPDLDAWTIPAFTLPASFSARPILPGIYDPGSLAVHGEAFSVSFADLERQTTALGIDQPFRSASDEEKARWISRLSGLALPAVIRSADMVGRLPELTGFDVTDIKQTAELETGQDAITSFTGLFDPDTLIAAWSSLGYEAVETGDVTIYSLAEGDTFDPSHPVQGLLAARHNNVALINRTQVIFAPRLDRLRDAIDAATGVTPGLDQRADVRAVLESAPMVSGILMPGDAFKVEQHLSNPRLEPQHLEVLHEIAEAVMPPSSFVVVGMTPGGPYAARGDDGDMVEVATPETARMVAALVTGSTEDAEAIVAMAKARFNESFSVQSLEPLTEIFDAGSGHVAPGTPVAVLEFSFGSAFPPVWQSLVDQRDFMLLG